MAMSRLEKLLMRVELIDKVTAPANKIMATMDKLTKNTAMGFANITGGAVGFWGVGTAIQSMTGDYRDFHHAVAEVSTLGVAADGLKTLERSALSFSIAYGESAADFVRSSYDIQSAIAGLTGNELAKFTQASNILAKGSKSDANTITNYMGTMYGIFQSSAEAMGKSKWVEQLTGQTSLAVEIFKSDGTQMSAAFTSLGADAQAHGIAINEQMAVLGKLQATMSGSEAGTKYKAFLRGVGAAQEELGMKFTDSAGRMLPVDQILGKLQKRFGAIDTVAESDLLKKAFGSDEAVASIKLLLNDTKGLTSAIDAIGQVKGMDHATWMAQQLVDPLARLNQAGTAVKIGFGALMEKAMLPFYNAGIEHLTILSQWIDKYPHLFGLLAKLALMIAAVVAVVSLLAIVKGLAIIAMAGYSTGLAIVNTRLLVVRAATWAWTTALGFSRAAVLATAIRFPALITGLIAMRAGFVTAALGARAFAMALLTNPITWIVLGVVALIAGLVMLVTHWDAVKAAAVGAITWMLEKWQAFRSVIEDNPILKFIFQPLLLAADFVGFLITNLEKIPAWFTNFKNWLSELNLFDVLMAPAKLAIEALNLLPGVNIDTSKLQQAIPAVPAQSVSVMAPEPVQKVAEQSPASLNKFTDGVMAGINPPEVNRSNANLKSAPVMQVAKSAPLQMPAVVNVAQPAPITIPAVLQVAEPAPMQVPLVANVAPPAPVTIPAALQMAEPANIPALPKMPKEVTTPKVVEQVEKLEEKADRERLSLAPPPSAPVNNVPAGGLQQQFNNNTRNRNMTIEKMEVNTTQMVSGYSLIDQLRMAGG